MTGDVVYVVEFDEHPDNYTQEMPGVYSTLDKAKAAAGLVDAGWLATHNAQDGWVKWYQGGIWWASVNNGQQVVITECEIDVAPRHRRAGEPT
jgi:hypothetical protein